MNKWHKLLVAPRQLFPISWLPTTNNEEPWARSGFSLSQHPQWLLLENAVHSPPLRDNKTTDWCMTIKLPSHSLSGSVPTVLERVRCPPAPSILSFRHPLSAGMTCLSLTVMKPSSAFITYGRKGFLLPEYFILKYHPLDVTCSSCTYNSTGIAWGIVWHLFIHLHTSHKQLVDCSTATWYLYGKIGLQYMAIHGNGFQSRVDGVPDTPWSNFHFWRANFQHSYFPCKFPVWLCYYTKWATAVHFNSVLRIPIVIWLLYSRVTQTWRVTS